MLWTIDSKARAGLKVISEIPDLSPCLLEGRNGIGKTVAVQLLEMISGQVPADFRRQSVLWASLRERIGETSVRIEGLQGGASLEMTFTPDRWPDDPPARTGQWLGNATIDGVDATAEDCAALISITRIAGDEDLEETLRRRVDTIKAYLESAAGELRSRGDAIDEALGDLLPDLERANPDELSADTARLSQSERQLEQCEREAALAAQRLDRLVGASETSRRLAAADQETEALLVRRDELVARVRFLDGERQSKEQEAAAADSVLAAEGDTQKLLSDSERLLRHRRSRLATLDWEVEELSGSLDVEPDPDAVTTAVDSCESALSEYDRRREELDATGVVRDLIEELITPLESAAASASAQTLIKNDEFDLTVAETLDGVSRRRQELVDRPQPAELRDVINQIESAKRRRTALRTLSSKLEALEQQQQRVAQAEAEAQQAATQAEHASDAATRSREANQAVGAAEAALTEAHRVLAEVQQRLGASGLASRDDAERDLRAALDELGLDEDALPDADRLAREALAAADRAVTEARDSASAVRRRLTTRRSDIDRLIDRLRYSQRYTWLFAATPDLARSLADPTERYSAFRRLRTVLLNLNESVYGTAQFLEALVGTAEQFFVEHDEELNGEEDHGGERLVQAMRPAFEAVLGHRLQETLNSPSIRKALFDGGEVARIEPGTRLLLLRGDDGREMHRPMEAFSTGERAFAFTQARIADLEVSTKPNRLLVLDEFGAFVAADRLPELAAFLGSEATSRVADQVVVILPLQVNYEAEIADTTGALRERYAQRLEQINERGYCAVFLE